MTSAKSLDDIPGPKGVPLLGNMFEIKQATLIQDLMKLGREWGPIFKITTPTGPIYVVYGLEMVDDLCDDARFDKLVGLSQREFRKTHKSAGLFTADTDDPLWKSAHDILLPSFSTWAMKGYLDPMIDIAEQLCLKWERLNPDEPIDVTADMTRLTLDTIALCGFSYRFNSFYRDDQHPFIEAMMGALQRVQARQRLLPVAMQDAPRRAAQAPGRQRAPGRHGRPRSSPSGRPAATRARTCSGTCSSAPTRHGKALPDHNIVAQMHDVPDRRATRPRAACSPSRSPTCCKHPEVVARAHEEVDRVLGTDPSVPPTYAQVQQARLHPADPQRDAAAVADRARLHPPGPGDHDGRRMGRRSTPASRSSC